MKTTLARSYLWMRNTVVYLLIFLIVLGLVLYYVVNSPLLIGKAADYFAPDYNLTYSSIHGNVFTGLQIDDLSHNKTPLAKQITLKWNPNTLATKTIHINTLKIKEANIEAIQAFVASFENNETNTTAVEPKEENAYIPTTVVADQLEITLLPLTFEPVSLNHLAFLGKGIVFDIKNTTLKEANLHLEVQTNFGEASYGAKAESNLLSGVLRVSPSQTLYETYDLPLNKQAVGDIVAEVNASADSVNIALSKTMKQFLKAKKDGFNMDVDALQILAAYDIAQARLQVDTSGRVSTPYAKDVEVNNHLAMDKNISYSGKVMAKQLLGIDAKLAKPLNDLTLDYKGDASSALVDIHSEVLQGQFVSKDFKSATLHLDTPKPLMLRELVALPAELNQTKATLALDMPLQFEANATHNAVVKIASNVINMDANISYKDFLELKSTAIIPQDSLLKSYSKELKWDKLNPVVLEAKVTDKQASATLNAGTLSATMLYQLDSTQTDGVVKLGGLEAKIAGKPKEKLNIQTNITSLASLFKGIDEIYTLGEVPPVSGSAEIDVDVTALKNIDVTLKSPQILYQADKKTLHKIDKLALKVSMANEAIQIPSYDLTYNEQRIFSTKPSLVKLAGDTISITPLWINDALQVQGEYNLKTQKGTINTTAQKLHIDHEMAAVDSGVDVTTVLDGNRTAINGEVTLLGGKILYDLSQKRYASDSDIVITKEIKKEKPSPFMEQLSVGVQVQTKKPFIYDKDPINIEAMVDVSLHKAGASELLVVGSVEILEGGTYLFERKKFVLGKSYVYFTGDPNKPLIEASVTYKSLNHLITLVITGPASAPHIDFSSVPTLSKEEILSVILFDSEGGAGTNSGEDMMKMMGGAMAKSALSDLGVKLDHLVLGASGSVEVGKKLSDDITVIYINDLIPTVKVKYKHTDHTESVIGASEQSQSYDIVYKKRFKKIY